MLERALFQIPRQGHDGGENGQRGRLAAEDAGAEADCFGTGLGGHLGFLGGKAALGTGDDGDLRLFAVGGADIGQQLPQRGTAALVAEEHEVVPFQTAADRAEVWQRQGHIRQDAPTTLLGGLEGDAVVALVLLLLFLGGCYAVAAEEGDEMSAAQLDAVADDLFQLVLLATIVLVLKGSQPVNYTDAQT